MKKDMKRFLVVAAIVLALYNLVVFLMPFEHETSFWVSYVFALLAFVTMAWAVITATVNCDSAKSAFYAFPIIRIAGMFCLTQLAVSLVFMVLESFLDIPAWIAVLVLAFIQGFAVIRLVSASATRDHIEQTDVKLKQNVMVMRALQSEVNQMVYSCTDPESVKLLKAFAEELRYSDPVSSDAIAYADADLTAAVNDLQQAVVEGNPAVICEQCRRATAALAERNRLCKLHKD